MTRHILENIPGLAVKVMTNRFERRKPDSFGLSCLKDGKIGHRNPNLLRQLGNRHLSLREHDIQINDYRHAQIVNLLSIDKMFPSLKTSAKI